MIDIIKNTIDILSIFIIKIYNLNVEFETGKNVKLGTIVIAFVTIVIIIYLIFKSIGINKGDD